MQHTRTLAARTSTPKSPGLAIAATLCAALTACGGGGGEGGGEGGGGGGGTGNATLTASLNALGVNTAASPRETASGTAVGSDFSPMGSTWEMSKVPELLLMGPTVDSTGAPWSLLDLRDENGNAVEEMLLTKDTASAPWITDTDPSTAKPRSSRDVCAADFDGDGLEEIVHVYVDGGEIRVASVDDEEAGFTDIDQQVAFLTDVTNVVVEAGDFDGDGLDEVALGLSVNGSEGVIAFVGWSAAAGWEELGPRESIDSFLAGATVVVDLSAGNTDVDAAEELLYSANEMSGSNYTPDGYARWGLLDDATTGFATLSALQIVQGQDQGSQLRTAEFCSVLLGDIDDDAIDEVVLTGMTEYARRCNGWGNFFMAFESADEGLSPLGNHYDFFFWDDCNSPADPRMHYLWSGMADFDGDGRDELFVNQLVYENTTNAALWTEATDFFLPEDAFWSQNEHGHRNLNTMDLTVGDFTGDGRDDIAIYRQDEDLIQVWGIADLQTTVSELRTVDTTFHNSQNPIQPRLVAVNVDTDSAILQYSEADYTLAFTEPIVIAALAAAPYRSGIQQNLGGCFTAFGNTSSGGATAELSVSYTASASVGVNLDGGALTQSEFEAQQTATVEARLFANYAYELSETIIYTTGASEDTVIFTCVPVDRYTYTVASHPDPAMVGERLVVNMPREPITLQAERSFYNQQIENAGLQITNAVMGHTIGDPSTYPSRSQRNATLAAAGGGLSIGPVSVGQGAGSTTVTLQVGQEIGVGGSLEIGYETSVEATAGGVMAGYTVGSSVGAAFSITSGSSTTYTGSVGSIGGGDFAANQYQFGLYTYVHRDPATGREYEVLDYWIE